MEETNPLLSEEDRLGLSNAAPIDSSEWTGGDPNAVSAPLPEAVVEEQLVEETLTSEEPAETSAPVKEDTSSSNQPKGGVDKWGWHREPAKIGELRIGSDVEGFATDPKYAAELVLAAPTGVVDTAIDVANMVLPDPFKVPVVLLILKPFDNRSNT